MARCNSCSAPLTANTHYCQYCGVHNAIDLQGKQVFSVSNKLSKRICPHCAIPLQTIKLKSDNAFYIERCKSCFGLFFDPNEIEILLSNSVSKVFEVNYPLLKTINKERYQQKKAFKYIKCPICRVLMNRVNFAHRSGVVIDRCKKHGIWLDNGKITHLMEWKKAGGQLLQAQRESQSKLKKNTFNTTKTYPFPIQTKPETTLEFELVESISSLIFKLFS